MSKNNLTDNHIKYLAQRDSNNYNLEKEKKEKAEKVKKEEELQDKEKEDAKCNPTRILVILLYSILIIAANYTIGISLVNVLLHYTKDDINRDYPIEMEKFCYYGEDILNKDNKVLLEENMKFAGQCSLWEMIKTIFEDLYKVFSYLGDKIGSVFNSFTQAIPRAAGTFAMLAEMVGDISDKNNTTPDTTTSKTPPNKKSIKNNLKGGASPPTLKKDTTTTNTPHNTPKQLHSKRTELSIKNDIIASAKCVPLAFSDGYEVFNNGKGGLDGQADRAAIHLKYGPLNLEPKPTLTLVSLFRYITINNGYMRWFLNSLKSIISEKDQDNFYKKAFITTFSSVIMVFFILYYIVAHISTLVTMIPPILGIEIGRHVSSEPSGENIYIYCAKDWFAFILTKLAALIWTPLIITLMFPIILLHNLFKYFCQPFFSNVKESKEILYLLRNIIIFVWLGILCSWYYSQFGQCPDDIFIGKLPIKDFPLIFSIASVIFFFITYFLI